MDSSFYEGRGERNKDGKLLLVIQVMSFVIGKLSQKEVTSAGAFVLTEKALYEFKGAAVNTKENRRLALEDVKGMVLSTDQLGRFIPLLANMKNTKTYEATEGPGKRGEFMQMLQKAYSAVAGSDLPVSEMPNTSISLMLKALSQGTKLTWTELITAVESGSIPLAESPAKVINPRKSLRSTRTPRKTGLGGTEGEVFASELWNLMEEAMEKPKTLDEVAAVKTVTAKLQLVVPSKEAVAGGLGTPRDEAHAMIGVASVLMDQAVCKTLLTNLVLPKKLGTGLLEDLEENLGSWKVLVRRWAAASFFSALPTFEQCSCPPQSTGWHAASRLHAEQVRNRENALAKLLFPAETRSGMSKEEDDTDEPFVLGGGPAESSKMPSILGNFKTSKAGDRKSNLGRNMTPSSKSGLGLPQRRTSNLQLGLQGAARRASNMFMSSLMGTGVGEDEFGETPRRQRSTFALVWLNRLLDLEDEAPPISGESSGIRKSDVQTLFQLLLGKTPDTLHDARSTEFEVETFGATVEYTEFIAPIIAALAATRSDEVRTGGLKQLNVLIMRNSAATRAFLSVPDWQSVIFSALYNVPFLAANRNSSQEDTYSYAMHMMTTIHMSVLGSKSQCSEFGPIDKLFGQTVYKLAVYSGWGEPTVSVVRSLFRGIFSTLAKLATRYNPAHDEWEEIFRLSNLLMTFLFYRPTFMGIRDVPELVAKASRAASSNVSLGPFNDWRARITHVPLLNRVQNDRLLAAHRQMYAKMNLPVMTAAHRGEETGLHLDESGMCADRTLTDTAIKLWGSMGITGNESMDKQKSEELSNKADRSRILYASNVCRELTEVLRLFDMIDDKRAAVLKVATKTSLRKATASSPSVPPSPNNGITSQQRDQVVAIAQSKAQDFLYKQKSKEQNVGFLSKAKTKNIASINANLRSNMLQKREVIRKLGSGSDSLKPQQVPTPQIIPLVSAGKSERSLMTHPSFKLHIRADEDIIPVVRRESSATDEVTVFEANAPRLSEAPARKTLVHLHKAEAPHLPMEEVELKQESKSSLVSKKRARAPMCYGCDRPIMEELNEVQKFGNVWHAECLTCSNCNKLVIGNGGATSAEHAHGHSDHDHAHEEGSGVLNTCRFYPNASMLLCSPACQYEVLQRENDARCAGCMDGFAPEEKTITACGHAYHVENKCFRCVNCDLPFDENRPFFEVQGSPYCGACLDSKFLRCKSCAQPLLDTDKVVEAQNWLYHDRCFVCSVCRDPFSEDNYFMGQHEGELLCYTHHLEHITPPCSFCHLPFNPKVESESPVTLAGMNFHRHCLQCSKCSRKLAVSAPPGSDEAAEEHDGSLFCTDCYVEEFGLQCHRCKLGIKGDILHAGIGKKGEAINWHPECFSCEDCSKALLDIPFFLVSVGEEDLVTVCNEHFHSRYSNKTCPGCKGYVSPGRNRIEEEEPLLPGMPRPATATSIAAPKWNDNPAIMYEEKMWHARCLTCEEPTCGVDSLHGLRMCSTHYHAGLDRCFTCKQVIEDNQDGTEMMDWLFHDRPECFCCSECKGPIEDGQPLVKLAKGPAHQRCPADAQPPTKKKSILKRMSATLSKSGS